MVNIIRGLRVTVLILLGDQSITRGLSVCGETYTNMSRRTSTYNSMD